MIRDQCNFATATFALQPRRLVHRVFLLTCLENITENIQQFICCLSPILSHNIWHPHSTGAIVSQHPSQHRPALLKPHICFWWLLGKGYYCVFSGVNLNVIAVFHKVEFQHKIFCNLCSHESAVFIQTLLFNAWPVGVAFAWFKNEIFALNNNFQNDLQTAVEQNIPCCS